MKKHIIGFTIFAFIVGSFVSIWALFGYFTQTIPNVPTVQSDNMPVFASDKKTSCFKQKSEKFSYEVVDSYYFADENMVVSTLKLKWNSYSAPPKNVFVNTKLFTADNKLINSDGGTYLKNTFTANNEVNVTVRTTPLKSMKDKLSENFYADFDFSSEPEINLSSKTVFAPRQVIVVHGNGSVISK